MSSSTEQQPSESATMSRRSSTPRKQSELLENIQEKSQEITSFSEETTKMIEKTTSPMKKGNKPKHDQGEKKEETPDLQEAIQKEPPKKRGRPKAEAKSEPKSLARKATTTTTTTTTTTKVGISASSPPSPRRKKVSKHQEVAHTTTPLRLPTVLSSSSAGDLIAPQTVVDSSTSMETAKAEAQDISIEFVTKAEITDEKETPGFAMMQTSATTQIESSVSMTTEQVKLPQAPEFSTPITHTAESTTGSGSQDYSEDSFRQMGSAEGDAAAPPVESQSSRYWDMNTADREPPLESVLEIIDDAFREARSDQPQPEPQPQPQPQPQTLAPLSEQAVTGDMTEGEVATSGYAQVIEGEGGDKDEDEVNAAEEAEGEVGEQGGGESSQSGSMSSQIAE